jgi:hypothetical protein
MRKSLLFSTKLPLAFRLLESAELTNESYRAGALDGFFSRESDLRGRNKDRYEEGVRDACNLRTTLIGADLDPDNLPAFFRKIPPTSTPGMARFVPIEDVEFPFLCHFPMEEAEPESYSLSSPINHNYIQASAMEPGPPTPPASRPRRKAVALGNLS